MIVAEDVVAQFGARTTNILFVFRLHAHTDKTSQVDKALDMEEVLTLILITSYQKVDVFL